MDTPPRSSEALSYTSTSSLTSDATQTVLPSPLATPTMMHPYGPYPNMMAYPTSTAMPHPTHTMPMHIRAPHGGAYKRPLPMPRKVLGTPTLALSPRATPPPPHKFIIGPGQRLVPKPMLPEYEYEHYQTPLTPPATPDVTALR